MAVSPVVNPEIAALAFAIEVVTNFDRQCASGAIGHLAAVALAPAIEELKWRLDVGATPVLRWDW